MVCAPTNKAVTVLATRFLIASRGTPEFNAVMIGDKEKLLTEDQTSSGLKSIFVYSYMEVMVDEWTSIRRTLQKHYMDVGALITTANGLVAKLDHQLPNLMYKNDIATITSNILQKLVELFSCGPTVQIGMAIKRDLCEAINTLIKMLKGINDRDITSELLSTAHIIFCTLASAGAVMVKQTDRIHDLIVDEAAAATEPELYIPFHLKPQRLLAVGDPKQLPATVMSRFAEKCGLNKSLHERLMYDCQWPYIMLNVQYRMRPPISVFPSTTFYQGEIQNGPNVTMPNYMTPMSLLKQEAYRFIQVNGIENQNCMGSYQNRDEAKVVVNILLELSHMARVQGKGPAWSLVDRIRIITFYQAQVTLIKSMLRVHGLESVVVSTVDSSQGCEADVVIVTFVRSVANGKIGFLADNRRLNVALTRAKFQLICVGNVKGMMDLDEAKTIQSLANNAHSRGCISSYSTVQHYGEKAKKKKSITNTKNTSQPQSRQANHHGPPSHNWNRMQNASGSGGRGGGGGRGGSGGRGGIKQHNSSLGGSMNRKRPSSSQSQDGNVHKKKQVKHGSTT